MFNRPGIDPGMRNHFHAQAHAASPTAPGVAATMADSAAVLARLAAGRPGGLTQGELLNMALNLHGDYARPVQAAARHFLRHRRAVAAAHEQQQRRRTPGGPSGGSPAAFDEEDFMAMGSVFQEWARSQDGSSDAGGGSHSGTHPHDFFQEPPPYEGGMDQAMRDLAGWMHACMRPSVSQDDLVRMDRRGARFVGHILDNLPAASRVFDGMVQNQVSIWLHQLAKEFGLTLAEMDERLAAEQAAAAAGMAAGGVSPGSPPSFDFPDGPDLTDAPAAASGPVISEVSDEEAERIEATRTAEELRVRRLWMEAQRQQHGPHHAGQAGGDTGQTLADQYAEELRVEQRLEEEAHLEDLDDDEREARRRELSGG